MDSALKVGVKALFARAAKLIDRESFEQEPNYTGALFGKLHGESVEHGGIIINFKASITNDRGPSSAESITGIDIGLIVSWEDENGEVNKVKAVLMQAKNHLYNISKTDRDNLNAQCEKMAKISNSYAVLDCPYDGSIPTICQRKKTPPPHWDIDTKQDLADYLIDVVMECNDGDTNPEVIEIAKKADRCIKVKSNGPVPAYTPTKKRKYKR